MKTYTKQELENIYRLNTRDEAAKKLGVSDKTMYKLLKQAGIELKGKSKRIDSYDKETIEEVYNMTTVAECCRILKVRPVDLYNKLKELGITQKKTLDKTSK